MIEEPIIKKKRKKKKKLNKLPIKMQYIYSGLILIVISIGIAYGLRFFRHNENGLSGTLTSSLVSIEASENGVINMEGAVPMKDQNGLLGDGKTLTITNTSATDLLLKLTVTEDDNSTIPTESIRYGLYLNTRLKNIDYVGPDNILYEGLLLKDETITIDVYLWIDYYYQEANTSFSGVFDVVASNNDMLSTEYLSRLLDKEKGLYAINSEGTLYNGTNTIREYRYSGNNVDNYVWFNCNPGYTSGSDNCELWRIVGSFKEKANIYTESFQRLKLVKDTNLDNNMAFGANNTFNTSSIKTYLNGTYYNSLTDSAKKMIMSSLWSEGSTILTNNANTSLASEVGTKNEALVGLLSASDIGYSGSVDSYGSSINASEVYTSSWLKDTSYYTINKEVESSTNVIVSDSNSVISIASNTETGIKPSVYLSPSVSMIGGNGTIENPYELANLDEISRFADIPVVAYITYNVNGQSIRVPRPQPIYADGVTVIGNDLTSTLRDVFLGWSSTIDGAVEYQKGDTIEGTTDVTLYAVWEHKGLSDIILMNGTNTTSVEVAKQTIANNSRETPFIVNEISPSATQPNGIYVTEDDNGKPTYFYRGGNELNNNVYFGGHYWKIVRINGDGSIRLIYNGATNNASGNAQSIGTGAYNSKYWDPTYVGYMYGENFTLQTSVSTSYNNGINANDTYCFGGEYKFNSETKKFNLVGSVEDGAITCGTLATMQESFTTKPYTCLSTSVSGTCNYILEVSAYNGTNSITAKYISYSSSSHDGIRTNEISSTIKTRLDTWYQSTFIGEGKVDSNGRKLTDYIVDGTFCSDRSITNGSNGFKMAPQSSYAGRSRLIDAGTKTATLKCNDIRDKFSTSTINGNGKLTYPIGLITADEVALAGLKLGITNADNYLRTGGHFWTMTPSYFDSTGGNARVVFVHSTGNLSSSDVRFTLIGARPVINLSSETLISNGIGTTADPFILTLS